MIISRTPFRISLCGGGSDLPSYYTKHGGCVLSTTINKYMYIFIHPSFQKDKTILKYSKTETVNSLDDIDHKYFKAILKQMEISGVEITSTADIPAGTGLGSSSSFAVGLLHSLYAYKGKLVSKEFIADEACKLEFKIHNNNIGKQDQYAAAYGGLKFYTFHKDGTVFVDPVIIDEVTLGKLQANLMLFYINGEHDASQILKEQQNILQSSDGENKQKKICDLTYELRDRLSCCEIDSVGKILHENWVIKRSLASGITNPEIDRLYELALANGALGGKILGAGGAGFLLLYVPQERQIDVKNVLLKPQQIFSFERQGSTIIYVGDE